MKLSDLVNQVDIIRKEHPGCGLEKLYDNLKPQTMGRDKFCELFMELGYRARKIKNYTRTTIPFWYNYPNLIEGMSVMRPFHVLQTDITYFDLNNKFYYLVFIMDVCTREILGYNVGDNMRVECNLKALKMALKKIPKQYLKTMIHHSDRGSQYGSKEYVKLLKDNGIKISMGMKAQDNAFADSAYIGPIQEQAIALKKMRNQVSEIRCKKSSTNRKTKRKQQDKIKSTFKSRTNLWFHGNEHEHNVFVQCRHKKNHSYSKVSESNV